MKRYKHLRNRIDAVDAEIADLKDIVDGFAAAMQNDQQAKQIGQLRIDINQLDSRSQDHWNKAATDIHALSAGYKTLRDNLEQYVRTFQKQLDGIVMRPAAKSAKQKTAKRSTRNK